MTKEAKRGEIPSIKKYFNIPSEKVGRDFKPTEKDLQIEHIVEDVEGNMEIAFLNKEVSDAVPQKAGDFFKELGEYTKKEIAQEKFSISLPCFDKRYERDVIGQASYKDGMEVVEFVIRDSKTGEILESKNIKFMNEFPPKFAEQLEQILREGYAGEKSN